MTTVSEKGEVKIPEQFLKALGILPGTEVEFEQQKDAVLMRVVTPKRVSRVEDGPKILNYTGPTVSLEEMEAAIPGALARTRVEEVAGCLKYSGTPKMLEEMDDAIGKSVLEHWRGSD